jgi:hypothetical protein
MTREFRGLGGWVTNDPDVAKKLRSVDMRYERAKIMTQGMRLGEKIEAQRVAKAEWQAEYDAIFASPAGDAIMRLWYRDNAMIAAYLAGRSIRSLAIEHSISERAVKLALRRNPSCRPIENLEG